MMGDVDRTAWDAAITQQVKLDCHSCPFTTGLVREAMDHAGETGHKLSGPGAIEGTDLTISLERD